MTDHAAKCRAIADKLAADIARLPAAIAKCREGTQVRARLEAQLERSKARVGIAFEKAALAEKKRSKLRKIEAANVGYMKRLDAMKADTPALTAQWKKEREAEEKKLATRRKQLQKRTYKDTNGDAQAADREQQNWWRRPVKLPDPIQQPDLAPLAPNELAPPPREGLIPGTYRVVDPNRVGGIVDKPKLPAVWTARLVGVRLIEAHRTLGRIPTQTRPAEYGSAWPAHQSEFGDQVIQAGAGTLFSGRSAPQRGASADEMGRMNVAISWPLQFLTHNRTAAADLNWWACDTSIDDLDFDSKTAPWDTLQFIADALNAAREPVI